MAVATTTLHNRVGSGKINLPTEMDTKRYVISLYGDDVYVFVSLDSTGGPVEVYSILPNDWLCIPGRVSLITAVDRLVTLALRCRVGYSEVVEAIGADDTGYAHKVGAILTAIDTSKNIE